MGLYGEEGMKIFPRQKEPTSGWTIQVEYLKGFRDRLSEGHSSLEEVEEMLLNAEGAMSVMLAGAAEKPDAQWIKPDPDGQEYEVYDTDEVNDLLAAKRKIFDGEDGESVDVDDKTIERAKEILKHWQEVRGRYIRDGLRYEFKENQRCAVDLLEQFPELGTALARYPKWPKE